MNRKIFEKERKYYKNLSSIEPVNQNESNAKYEELIQKLKISCKEVEDSPKENKNSSRGEDEHENQNSNDQHQTFKFDVKFESNKLMREIENKLRKKQSCELNSKIGYKTVRHHKSFYKQIKLEVRQIKYNGTFV